MRKFYFRFQWLGVILIPLVITVAPSLLGITTAWGNSFMPIIAGLTVFGFLLAIAIITTRTGNKNGRKSIPPRVSALLEASYVASFALLLTSGSMDAEQSNSALVSVLLDRGVGEINAWFANDVSRTVLFILLFFFLFTVLVSAIRERAEINHRTISRYEIVPILDDDPSETTA